MADSERPLDGDEALSHPLSDTEVGDLDEAGESISLDRLSQAFADVLGRNAPPGTTPDSDAAASSPEPPARAETIEQATDSGTSDQAPDDEDACPITPRSILEAILFVGHPEDLPITSRMVADLLRGVEPGEVDDLVKQLNEGYEATASPYRIISVGAGYRMQLCEEYAPLRNKFYGHLRQARLSQTAIDVLSIVAYHQPVSREEIDRLRGSKSGRVLAQLVRRELIRFESSTEDSSHKLYQTTERFLALFALEGLHELPRSDQPE